jgi:hypothetical protein
MTRFDIINFGWNQYNGFCFEILNIEWDRFSGILFGVSFSFGEYLRINLFFFSIDIESPLYLKDIWND